MSETEQYREFNYPTTRELMDVLTSMRRGSGVSQRQMSLRMCQAQATVSQLESGRSRMPEWKTVVAYAKALGARVTVAVVLEDPRPEVRTHLGQVWPPEDGMMPLATTSPAPVIRLQDPAQVARDEEFARGLPNFADVLDQVRQYDESRQAQQQQQVDPESSEPPLAAPETPFVAPNSPGQVPGALDVHPESADREPEPQIES